MDGPAGGRGKWSEQGVPHRGWTCIEIEDLGSADATCNMCESQSIRFVHHMAHEDYEDILPCGCVCAGHMEEDLSGAERRDRAMRNRASRRKKFPKLQSWILSAKGNPTIKIGGFRITVFPRDGGFKAVASRDHPRYTEWTRRPLHTTTAAKLAAFDLLTMLQERLSTEPVRRLPTIFDDEF